MCVWCAGRTESNVHHGVSKTSTTELGLTKPRERNNNSRKKRSHSKKYPMYCFTDRWFKSETKLAYLIRQIDDQYYLHYNLLFD